MNTVVNRLLDVDRQARQLLDEARQYYEKTLEEINQEQVKIKEKYKVRAEKHVADVARTERAVKDEAIGRIKAEEAEKTRMVVEAWEQGHAAWEQAIFSNCVKKVAP